MGPLAGFKIIEMGAIGPVPMAAMILSDLGADILRIERRRRSRLGIARPVRFDLMRRGRPAITLDLKSEAGRACLLDLAARSDALIEGFRPGVMERLGLGPEDLGACNARLVYGRMTGWGQDGPLAAAAGHDLNYIALAGALHAIGRRGQPPTPPLTLVGDFAGGALYLAIGVLAGLLEASRSGRGQVVDAAIIDGVASLMVPLHGLLAAGIMRRERGTNTLDSGAFFYDCYECADGRWISIAPIEAKFFAELLARLGLDADDLPAQDDVAAWPDGRARLAALFAQRTQAQWCALLEGSDACFAPVLAPDEAPGHAHCAARATFVRIDGIDQGGPAPRFSRTRPTLPTPPQAPDTDTASALAGWLAPHRIAALRADGVLR